MDRRQARRSLNTRHPFRIRRLPNRPLSDGLVARSVAQVQRPNSLRPNRLRTYVIHGRSETTESSASPEEWFGTVTFAIQSNQRTGISHTDVQLSLPAGKGDWVAQSSNGALELTPPVERGKRNTVNLLPVGREQRQEVRGLWFRGSGSLWEWCAACRHYEHMSVLVPDEWRHHLPGLDPSKLRHHPEEVFRALSQALRPYRAMIWIEGSAETGKRVSVTATSLSDARQRLEGEYGKGNVFDLHNPDDADASRSGPPD